MSHTETTNPAGSLRAEPTLYFAFDGNLSLTQMAWQCPQSRYIGRAVLNSYRWQINQNGFANIHPKLGHRAEGLVFELRGDDEERLDRNKAAAKGTFSKEICDVSLYYAPTVLLRVPVVSIIDLGGPASILAAAKQRGGGEELASPILTKALVYIDKLRVDDGPPRVECISQMKPGIADAVVLGVDPNYISAYVWPALMGEPRPQSEESSLVDDPRPQSEQSLTAMPPHIGEAMRRSLTLKTLAGSSSRGRRHSLRRWLSKHVGDRVKGKGKEKEKLQDEDGSQSRGK